HRGDRHHAERREDDRHVSIEGHRRAMAPPGARRGVDPPRDVPVSLPVQIPAHALPSYAGRHASVKYILSARLDVPLWLDTVWTTEIYVFYDRTSVRTFAQPVRFRSGGQGPEVYVELDGDRFFARELIGCRITLSRTENARI